MKINVEILQAALVHDPKLITSLNEKELVPKMIIRRRMSRASKIVTYLADQCGFKTGAIVYGSAFGELPDSVTILESIKNKEPVSPSAFQNSVYNTAVSYHSIVQGNTDEIITLSSGSNTSYTVMQQSALLLMKKNLVFACCCETMNFNAINELNICQNELEYGLGFLLQRTNKETNISFSPEKQKGVPDSLQFMKSLYDALQKVDNPVLEIEL